MVLNVHEALTWTGGLKKKSCEPKAQTSIFGMPPQALSSSEGGSNFVLCRQASHYHSGRLRLCHLCRSQPSPPTVTAGGSDFVVFVVQTSSNYRSGKLPSAPKKSCKPNPRTDHLLKQDFLGSPFHRGQRHPRNRILRTA